MINRVLVKLNGQRVGVVEHDSEQKYARFQYAPEFIEKGVEVSPIRMPLSKQIYTFPNLTASEGFENTFMGLPGMLADPLPEKFGNKLLGTWLARHGKSIDDLTPLDRLSYLGRRGMGALEFEPEIIDIASDNHRIEVSELVEVAKQVLAESGGHKSTLKNDQMETLISIGTSAGGAKAKAVIAWNRETNEVVSGLDNAPEDFEHWLVKFDEFENEEHAQAKEIGRIEYAYYLMALDAGIEMMESRLFEAEGLAHFMTRRFDRIGDEKFHVQSFCALAHADRNPPGEYGYEDLFNAARQIGCDQRDLDELFGRMVFNVMSRNQDDHTKNHAFIMDPNGSWFPSPAYDLCFSYKPGNRFIESHQMSVNGKRDGFVYEDLIRAAKVADVKDPDKIIQQVRVAIENWPTHAKQAGLSAPRMDAIERVMRREVATPRQHQSILKSVNDFREDKAVPTSDPDLKV